MISIAEGAVVAGKYRLERALARGGMGSVWVAHHLQLDVTVAIKFMDPSLAASGDGRRRFEREAQAAAKLKSPHVVQVHDFGVEDDTPYIVMELLAGEDLETRLERLGRMTPAALAPLVSQVAKALRRAHETGIVHRDLKPLNIFISRQDEEEVAKILDFGIAKAPDTGIGKSTKTGALIGSPHYMSPEQARGGKQLDHRSDLWSLGVILFRAVTGRLPFPGDDLGDVLVAICADPIPIASKVAPDLGPEIDRFFEKALQRDMDQRFQSARELAEAFAALASPGAPVAVVGPPSSRSDFPSAAVAPSVPPAAIAPAGAALPASTLRLEDAALPASPPVVAKATPPPTPASTGGGTLSPAGHSIVQMPPERSRAGRIAAGIGVLAVGLGVLWFTVLRAPAGTSSPAAATAPNPTTTLSQAPPIAVSAPVEIAAATAAASASSAPVESASASASVAPPAPPPSALPRARPLSPAGTAARPAAAAPPPAAPSKPNKPVHDDGI